MTSNHEKYDLVSRQMKYALVTLYDARSVEIYINT